MLGWVAVFVGVFCILYTIIFTFGAIRSTKTSPSSEDFWVPAILAGCISLGITLVVAGLTIIF